MSQLLEIKVPDIGNYHDVPVIEVCVKIGDSVKIDDPLITLETEKATMDVPSTSAGIIKEIKVKVGDKISQGSTVAIVEAAEGSATAAASGSSSAPPTARAQPVTIAQSSAQQAPSPGATASPSQNYTTGKTHASPSVRLFGRELGVDLSKVPASGPKGRILKEDVKAYVKGMMTSGGASLGGLDLIPWPKIDFTKFGPIEVKPLPRIKKFSGQNLARNWVMIPSVTYHEDADVTDLEAFRVATNKENGASGTKITMVAFLIKASSMALHKFPEFNSSLDGDNLVIKKYFHIGFAADTPAGLVVPVIKNVDQKSVTQIAIESAELAKKARDGKISPADMSGACFTISSLGGIGGTGFSPIINAPEVAILGVSKSVMKPVWNGKEFAPRLTLPMSLAADHRVIDGALATRFNLFIAELLGDTRRLLL